MQFDGGQSTGMATPVAESHKFFLPSPDERGLASYMKAHDDRYAVKQKSGHFGCSEIHTRCPTLHYSRHTVIPAVFNAAASN